MRGGGGTPVERRPDIYCPPKVSQSLNQPFLTPRANHWARCLELPSVNVCGMTPPAPVSAIGHRQGRQRQSALLQDHPLQECRIAYEHGLPGSPRCSMSVLVDRSSPLNPNKGFGRCLKCAGGSLVQIINCYPA